MYQLNEMRLTTIFFNELPKRKKDIKMVQKLNCITIPFMCLFIMIFFIFGGNMIMKWILISVCFVLMWDSFVSAVKINKHLKSQR